MKNCIKIMSAYFCILVFLIYHGFAQSDSTKPVKLTETQSITIAGITHSEELSISYVKRSIPPIKNGDNNFAYDGNNFLGIASGTKYNLSENFAVGYCDNLQFGNVGGNFALYVNIIPEIQYGSKFFYIFAGAGLGILAIDKNKYAGGFGITAVLGMEYIIYNGIGLIINTEFEQYAHANYNTFGLGIIYSFNK